MAATTIAWTDHSINPIRAYRRGINAERVAVGHYCEKISPGCANCYASTLQKRFRMPEFGSAKNRGNVECVLDESKLQEVLRRRKPTKYFWCDMTDMFGEWVPFEWIDKIFATMAMTPQHVHQVLTKRPERMQVYLTEHAGGGRHIWEACQNLDWPRGMVAPGNRWPLRQVWLGTSIENQATANERIPHLLRCPAAVRFLSCEPMLGAIDFKNLHLGKQSVWIRRGYAVNVDWVIYGCESGPKRRPGYLKWVADGLEQCRKAGVAAFVKQLPINGRVSHDPSEWPEWARVRQFPRGAAIKVADFLMHQAERMEQVAKQHGV